MSTTDIHEQDTETAERPFLVREFVATDMEIKGRTVDVRVVPFGEVARVADPPEWVEYEEEWMPKVFDHQLNAANRIHAKYGHSASVVDVVGHGLSLRSDAGGYLVTSTIHETIQGETTLELLRGGALPAVSLEAHPVRSHRTSVGVVQRIRANLTGFAFCRVGAFAGAQVLAMREAPDVVIDEELLPVEMDNGVVERLRRQGFSIPDRYKAHPDDNGHPDTVGTPGDGTRQPIGKPSSEE